MIEYIRGELADLSPTFAVVEAGGVGYGLGISLCTYEAIRGSREVRLYVAEVIREDSHVLWGFATKAERELFLLLTSVSGIGGATARVALSSMSPAELVKAIGSGDERALKGIKGIGAKAAQRIIMDLRDKAMAVGISPAPSSTGIDKELMGEAVSALTMLGFQPGPSHTVVAKLLAETPSMTIEEVIKKALKLL